MTQDDILQMARSAGLTDGIELQHEIDAVMRFAEMVAAAEREGLEKHGLGQNIGKPSQLADAFRQGVKWGQEQEREACAKVCDKLVSPSRPHSDPGRAWITGTIDCAAAIRARGSA